jgi:hypothetical protein
MELKTSTIASETVVMMPWMVSIMMIYLSVEVRCLRLGGSVPHHRPYRLVAKHRYGAIGNHPKTGLPNRYRTGPTLHGNGNAPRGPYIPWGAVPKGDT